MANISKKNEKIKYITVLFTCLFIYSTITAAMLEMAYLVLRHFLNVLAVCYRRRVLMVTDGLDDISGMQWELFALLLVAWVLVYFIISKGLNESGKVIKKTIFPKAFMKTTTIHTGS